jgi:hypothetical protein
MNAEIDTKELAVAGGTSRGSDGDTPLSRRQLLAAGAGAAGLGVGRNAESTSSASGKASGPRESGTKSFGGRISRQQLEHYLSHAITFQGLTASFPEGTSDTFDDDVRMLANIGARFVGQAGYAWAPPNDDDAHFALAAERARKVHRVLPDVMLQAAVFETAYTSVENIQIPGWVFAEFDMPKEQRTFDYEAMLFENGRFVDHWGPGASVPDVRRRETQLWFFYRAARYIDAGHESIHFGQMELTGAEDSNHDAWAELLSRVRRYARRNARRGLVLISAHTYGLVRDGKLLLDFHSWPLRPDEVVDQPQHAVLRLEQDLGNLSGIYRRSKGGVTPSGWYTDSLTYVVEFDNYGGVGPNPGEPDLSSIWTWGYDEIAWFARQPESYRNSWLRYAWDWVRANDPTGWVMMPGRRTLGNAPITLEAPLHTADGTIEQVKAWMFKGATRSTHNPAGFSVEETIKAIWNDDR